MRAQVLKNWIKKKKIWKNAFLYDVNLKKIYKMNLFRHCLLEWRIELSGRNRTVSYAYEKNGRFHFMRNPIIIRIWTAFTSALTCACVGWRAYFFFDTFTSQYYMSKKKISTLKIDFFLISISLPHFFLFLIHNPTQI